MVNPINPRPKISGVRVKESALPWLVRRQWRAMERLMVVYPEDRILDAQCMDGTLLHRLARKDACALLCGACYMPAQVRHARRLVCHADIMLADEEALPWINATMDVAFMARGFHTLENPQATLREINRVLKSGGQFLLAGLWAPPVLRGVLNWALFPGRARARIRSRKETFELLHTVGFDSVYFYHVGFLGYVAMGLKK